MSTPHDTVESLRRECDEARHWVEEYRDAYDKANAEVVRLRALVTMPTTAARAVIYREIDAERERQDAKWGPVRRRPDVDPVLAARGASHQRICEEHEIPTETRAKFLCENAERRGECSFTAIVVEELAEVVAKHGTTAMREELIQLAACIVKWVEAVDLPNGGAR